MRLSTEVTVAAPLEGAWPALLELGGPLSMELGGRWEVSAMLDDADEDEHAAGFHVVGHEHGGNGMAAATVRAHARAGDNGDTTRIAFETDLRLTGAAERTDEAAAQAAADELLGRVAAHLERASTPTPVVEAAPEVGPPEPPEPPDPPEPSASRSLPYQPAPDPLIAASGVAERAWLLTAGLALGIVLGRLVWRRR